MRPSVFDRPSPGHYPALVGRSREQDVLRQVLNAVLEGYGALVLVSGEAGIGKTSLVEWLARDTFDQGCLVLRGGCYDLTTTPPYGPWSEIARHYAPSGHRIELPAFISEQSRLEALDSQEALFEEVWAFLASVADQQPVILVLEDLHWSDTASLDLLRVVSRRLTRHRMLILATYRSDELPLGHRLSQLLPPLVREAHALRLTLRRLDQAETSALVRSRFELSAEDHDRLSTWLFERADGNPFFSEELLHNLQQKRLHQDEAGRWRLGDLESVGVPPLLRQAVEIRLSSLGEEAIQLLGVGAVIGQEVPLDLWATVTEAPLDRLVNVTERAEAASILEDLRDGSGWRFRHSLLRQALYEDMSLPRRHAWHRRVGEVLAAEPRPDPDAVASQFQQAGDPRTVDWLIRASERAESVYALRTAAERDEVAAALLEGKPDRAGERAWLLYRTARNVRFADIELSINFLRAALEAATLVDDNALQARVRWELGLQQCNAGHYREGIAEMRLADTLVHGPPSADLMEQQHAELRDLDLKAGTLVIMLAHGGRYAEAIEDGEFYLRSIHARLDADDLLERAAGGWTAWADGYFGLALARSACGEPDRALELFATARQGYRAARHHALESLSLAHCLQEVLCPYRADDLSDRSRLAEEAEAAAARAGGALRPDTSPLSAILPVLLIEGRWDVAYTAALSELTGIGLFPEVAQRTVAELGWRRGDPDLAWEQIRTVLPDGPETEPGDTLFFNGVALQRIACRILLEAGRLSDARAWIEAHDQWIDWSGAILGRADRHLLWACYHQASGRNDLARDHAVQAIRLATDPRQPLVLISIHRLLGQIDAREDRFDRAEEHIGTSLALADACAAKFERALSLLELADLRLRQRRTDETRHLLDQIRFICEPLGARPTLERVGQMRLEIERLPRQSIPNPGGLTPREVEVLRFVADGLTDAEVAERLSLSPRTIGSHLRSVYSKLGVGSRAAATVWARKQRLI